MLAVLFTALTVDSGRLWMQQRQLQLVADIASMDAARAMGCAGDIADVVAAANASAARNGYAGSLSAAPNIVELGTVTTNAGGIRQFAAGGQGAVHVYATRSVPASLVAGGLFNAAVVLNAEAVSSANAPLAAFSAGTFAASISTEEMTLANALLGGMLGSSVNLSLVSYQGIAATNITLLDLIKAQGQAGGVNELLTTNMQVGELLELMATAVSNSSTASAAAKAGMQQLAAAAAPNTTSITLGDVLNVTAPDQESAANVGINAFSLVMTSAVVANGQHALSVPLSVNVPAIASINGQVTVIEAPKLAVGPAGLDGGGNYCTSVQTAQVRARVQVATSIPLLAKIDLLLTTEVAQGSAGLDTISDDGASAAVGITANPGIVAMTLTNSAGTGPARISTLLNLPIADLSLNLPVQSSPQPLNFAVDHPIADNLPQVQTASSPLGGSLENALQQSSAINVSVLSLLNLGLVNNVVTNTVRPLLGEIGRVLLDPLLNMLGIRVGGMDVTLEGVQLQQSRPLQI